MTVKLVTCTRCGGIGGNTDTCPICKEHGVIVPYSSDEICRNCGLPMKEHLNRDGKCDLDPAVKDRR